MAVDAARAKSLFLAASDLAAPAERAAFLERACGGDAELRARVEALLRANDAAPLPVPPGATVDSAPGQPETEDHADPTARVGAVLAGKYKLDREVVTSGTSGTCAAEASGGTGRTSRLRSSSPPITVSSLSEAEERTWLTLA